MANDFFVCCKRTPGGSLRTVRRFFLVRNATALNHQPPVRPLVEDPFQSRLLRDNPVVVLLGWTRPRCGNRDQLENLASSPCFLLILIPRVRARSWIGSTSSLRLSQDSNVAVGRCAGLGGC
jgi:hypothetical protein